MFFIDNVVAKCNQVVSLEGRFKLRQVVQSTADSPHVYFEIVRLLFHEFGAQIKRRANSSVLLKCRRSDYFWNP